jgi:signal transduction histidine kinase
MPDEMFKGRETRVLLIAPTARDAEITHSLLKHAGLTCVVCQSIHQLTTEMASGAGAVLLTEDALAAKEIDELLAELGRQPSWSDLPVVVLIRGGVQSPAANRVLGALRNATLLERPAPTRSMVSAVQAAVRGRLRQYQIRDQIDALCAAAEERKQLLSSEHAARTEADRANRMKDEFLATLSHELRTPLNAILGWAQLLQRAPQDPGSLEGVQVIERNARILTQLIEDLLDMSRIVSGKVKLDMLRIELGAVIQAAVDVVRPSAEAKGVALRLHPQASPTPMIGDSARLQQVIWNLLSNSVKFTPQGGVVDVRLRREGSHVEISVADTGAGIEPEFQPYMFERFRQANSSTTRAYGGLGLGLSIVKHLVEMHSGSVSAYSAGKGRGSTFTVRLPIQAPWMSNDSPRHPEEKRDFAMVEDTTIRLEGVTILLVDDEPDTRRWVKRVLEERAAKVVTVESSAEALQTLKSLMPDVIVSDIGMPNQDG